MRTICYILLTFLMMLTSAPAADVFNIKIVRRQLTAFPGQPAGNDFLISGPISINGKAIGSAYENLSLCILPGKFAGTLRYNSGHNFVQNPFGELSHEGDFLVEVVTPPRTNILFHPGNQPKHSQGCILLGPAGKNPVTGTPEIGPDHPLRVMRVMFYGTETPNACPDKSISIEIVDELLAGTWTAHMGNMTKTLTFRDNGTGTFAATGSRPTGFTWSRTGNSVAVHSSGWGHRIDYTCSLEQNNLTVGKDTTGPLTYHR